MAENQSELLEVQERSLSPRS